MTGGPGASSLPQDNDLSLTELSDPTPEAHNIAGPPTPKIGKRHPSERKTPHMYPPHFLPVSTGRRMQVAENVRPQMQTRGSCARERGSILGTTRGSRVSGLSGIHAVKGTESRGSGGKLLPCKSEDLSSIRRAHVKSCMWRSIGVDSRHGLRLPYLYTMLAYLSVPTRM